MYDSGVKVPKTTRWRRKLENSSSDSEDANVVVQGRDQKFSSEVIEGLRKNTSPLKKQKLLDDCLTDEIVYFEADHGVAGYSAVNSKDQSQVTETRTTVLAQVCDLDEDSFCMIYGKMVPLEMILMVVVLVNFKLKEISNCPKFTKVPCLMIWLSVMRFQTWIALRKFLLNAKRKEI